MNIPQVKPNKAKAWFITVLNPIINALESEIRLLTLNNWTYDSRIKNFYRIKPIEYWVDSQYLPNLSDVLKKIPELKPDFDKHDCTLSSAIKTCNELYNAITHSSNIGDIKVITSHDATLSELVKISPEGVTNNIAELLINNIEIVDEANVYKPLFVRLEQTGVTPISSLRSSLIGDTPSAKQAYVHLQDIGTELLNICKALQKNLDNIRTQISDEADVPIVPIID